MADMGVAAAADLPGPGALTPVMRVWRTSIARWRCRLPRIRYPFPSVDQKHGGCKEVGAGLFRAEGQADSATEFSRRTAALKAAVEKRREVTRIL